MSTMSRLARSVPLGFLCGAGIGLSFVALGALRAAVLLASGERVAPMNSHDVRLLAWYCGAFTIAGGTIGGFWPWIHRRIARYIAFYFAGAIVVTGIASSRGGKLVLDGDITSWLLVGTFGLVMGLGGIYVFETNFPRHAGVGTRRGRGQSVPPAT